MQYSRSSNPLRLIRGALERYFHQHVYVHIFYFFFPWDGLFFLPNISQTMIYLTLAKNNLFLSLIWSHKFHLTLAASFGKCSTWLEGVKACGLLIQEHCTFLMLTLYTLFLIETNEAQSHCHQLRTYICPSSFWILSRGGKQIWVLLYFTWSWNSMKTFG